MSRSRPVPALPDVSRRTALAAVGGALLGPALAGCGEAPVRGPAAADPDTDPDAALLAEVLADLDAALALVTALARRERRLREALRPLARTHRAHRAVLAEAGTGAEPSTRERRRLPEDPGAALALVRRQEERLAARLARAAVEAQSGTFGRALASMSASLHQHVRVLEGAA